MFAIATLTTTAGASSAKTAETTTAPLHRQNTSGPATPCRACTPGTRGTSFWMSPVAISLDTLCYRRHHSIPISNRACRLIKNAELPGYHMGGVQLQPEECTNAENTAYGLTSPAIAHLENLKANL